jgi:Barstar (barnase inhibitor)
MKTAESFPIPFEFREIRDDESRTGSVLCVPTNLQSKSELLIALAKAGRFPRYFGNNWDSLLDCLRDFHWIEEKRIVVMHSDLPLRANPPECRIYLEVLRDAARDWARSPNGAATTFPDHDFCVVFPASLQSTVSDILA